MKLLGKGEQAQVIDEFQLLLKGCTIEAGLAERMRDTYKGFQLLLKGCTIEAKRLS